MLAIEDIAGIAVAHDHRGEGLVDARACQWLAVTIAVGECGEPNRDRLRCSRQGLQVPLGTPGSE
jgi:hypothetical protein